MHVCACGCEKIHKEKIVFSRAECSECVMDVNISKGLLYGDFFVCEIGNEDTEKYIEFLRRKIG